MEPAPLARPTDSVQHTRPAPPTGPAGDTAKDGDPAPPHGDTGTSGGPSEESTAERAGEPAGDEAASTSGGVASTSGDAAEIGGTAREGAAGGTAAPVRLERGEERRPRDMVLSLVVLLVPIALLLVFYRVVLSGDAPVTVDPSATFQEARQAAAFTVVEPRGLSGDWHVSSANFDRQGGGATLRIGYVDPDKDPVQLVQSSVPAATLLRGELGGDAKALGVVRTAAGVWRVYDARPGETALVLADQKRTIVIVGKTDVTNLQALAAILA